MKEFLRAFNSGVFEKDLSGEQKELVRNLLNIGAISAHKGKLYLNDGYVFGRLDIARDGTGYLQSFDDRFKADLIIENRYLGGVHLGDLILAKILSSKKVPSARKGANVRQARIFNERGLYQKLRT